MVSLAEVLQVGFLGTGMSSHMQGHAAALACEGRDAATFPGGREQPRLQRRRSEDLAPQILNPVSPMTAGILVMVGQALKNGAQVLTGFMLSQGLGWAAAEQGS